MMTLYDGSWGFKGSVCRTVIEISKLSQRIIAAVTTFISMIAKNYLKQKICIKSTQKITFCMLKGVLCSTVP